MTKHRPLIAAHRGGALLWPENSLTAFRGALELPVDQIETDVRLSADGEPFLLHDPSLDRTTEAQGPCEALSWAELSRIRLKGADGDRIPHLRELLDLLAPSAVDLRLELKTDAAGRIQDGLAEAALAALARSGLSERTTITSFDLRYLAEVADAPLAGRIWLVRRALIAELGLDEVTSRATAASAPEIALHISQAEVTLHRPVSAGSLPRIGFYAVNDAVAIATALAREASAFTTDRPDLATAMAGRASRSSHGTRALASG